MMTTSAPMMTAEQTGWFARGFAALVSNVEHAVLGKRHVIELAITCMLSEGHLLLEDYPGTGKTSLAKSVANSVQATHSRIQFTPDLLPSDVTGVTIYDQYSGGFEFHGGPIFANVVLADEINRASPKTQSALLEVMEEGRVTVDGNSHPVGQPFMVIATQNPIEQAGTYRLPEAQLDRFLMKTSLGYPDHESTVALLADAANRDRASGIGHVMSSKAVAQMSQVADRVHIAPAILSYVSKLAHESRQHPNVRLGLSVRGCLGYVRAAKTWAAADGRGFVVPDDIKDLAVPILSHRLLLDPEAEFSGVTVEEVIDQLLSQVRPPTKGPA